MNSQIAQCSIVALRESSFRPRSREHPLHVTLELPIQTWKMHTSAEATAEAALKVVKRRSQRASDSHDNLATMLMLRLLLHTAVPPVCTRLMRRCNNLGLRPCTFLRWQLHT